MKKNILVILTLFAFLFLAVQVLAGNETAVNGSAVNDSVNDSMNTSTNISANESAVPSNVSTATIAIKNFFPKTSNIGDLQLNINVQNIGTSELTNLAAFVSGDGFSSYDVVPIDSLAPQEKSYILISGNFKKAGAINLTIKINQEVFYEIVNVVDSSASASVQADQKLAAAVTGALAALKQNYSSLESDVQKKQSGGYDVSGVSLTDLKSMIRDAQANLLSGNYVQANVKINLALDEYSSQTEKLSYVKKISLGQKLKDNAVLFSAIAGSIITFFTLYELLKKKSGNIKEKIKSIHVKDKNGNTMTVETK
jgi:hypothetical protein